MYKDLEFSVIKVVGGEVRYCLGDDVEVGASGNHYPTFPQILLPIMSLSTLAMEIVSRRGGRAVKSKYFQKNIILSDRC